MSLFQLILFGLLGVFILPVLLGLISAVICGMLLKTSELAATLIGISVGVITFVTGIVFVAQAIARMAS